MTQTPPPGGPSDPYAGGAYPGGSTPPPAPPSNPLAALFDFGFNQFVTPHIVKFAYILLTVVLAVGYVVVVVGAFLRGGLFGGLLALIGGAVAALVYLILIRVTLEFYYAVVRMSEDIHHRMPNRS
ncbi:MULTISPECIES: DUF4282 domain-containing protein [unclassified Pseudonocardia]|uniref:DUF4282 domain-containing protein n=1 Tax=unclassified Pseudonocardia TaxID=2619320 RepID=UPI0001FFF244|nr:MULTISPECIES: DUF4282 domain-containing protein [unclassified Pseudonocardia]OLM19126.1 hypothetical protein Ae707Ps1_3385c [Pseudonocardia sp. Ae707_Ps1]